MRRDEAARGADADACSCPIDACYRLVGLVRLHWRGFDGGAEAWHGIDGFFDDLREQARPVATATGPEA